MKYSKLILLSLLILLAVSACNRGGKPGPKANDSAQPVMVEELELRSLSDFITVSGKLEGITNIVMSAESAGRVLQLYKRLGDRVAQGERIGRLDNEVSQIRVEQAQAALASAQASFDNAQRNLNYAEESRRRNLISEAEYNTSLSAFTGARAGVEGARAGLEQARSGLSGSYLTAPESGIISNLNVAVGQFLAAGQPVATITNASSLILKTGVGESQIGKLRVGQTAVITVVGASGEHQGRVRGFGISPLQGSSNYPLEIEIASPRTLMPGMVVSAKILTNTFSNLLYTDITNIVREYDKNYLYVITAENKAEKRPVTLGNVIGEFVVIASGAEPGEKIVTSGAENLEEGSLVEIRQ